jgi:hypothetical protein
LHGGGDDDDDNLMVVEVEELFRFGWIVAK